jgi:hypothetical protein
MYAVQNMYSQSTRYRQTDREREKEREGERNTHTHTHTHTKSGGGVGSGMKRSTCQPSITATVVRATDKTGVATRCFCETVQMAHGPHPGARCKACHGV